MSKYFWIMIRLFTAVMLSAGGLLATTSFVAAAPAAQAQKGAGVGFSNLVAIPSSAPAGVSIQGAAAQGSNAATGLEILKDKRAHGIVITDGHNSEFQVKWTAWSDDGDSFGPFVSTVPANTQYTRMDPKFDFVKIKDKSFGYIDAEIVGGPKFGQTKVLYQAGVNPQWVTPTPTTDASGSPCFFFDYWTVDIKIAHEFLWTDKQGTAHAENGETITIDNPNGSHVSGTTKIMSLPATDDPTTPITIHTTSWKGSDPQARHEGWASGFYNTCVTPPPPPQQDSATCNNMTPTYVALKPGEQQMFKLHGTKVITYAIELDGTNVSNTDSFTFVAGSETFTHTLVGKVAGADGKVMSADSCTAQIVVSQNPPPPPTQQFASCSYINPHVAALKPGESVEFTLVGDNASQYQFEMGGQIVSHTEIYVFKAHDLGTFDITGSVAGDDGKFVSGQDCVARVVVVNNPPPIGKDRMWVTDIHIIDCRIVPQFPGEYVLWRGDRLIHINTKNRPANENWDVIASRWSTDGDNWNQGGATREIGIEAKTVTTTLDVGVIWTAEQQSQDAPSTWGQTHEFAGNTLPGVNFYDYKAVRAAHYHVVNPINGDLLYPAKEGTAADKAYKWAYDTAKARCTPQQTFTTPGDNTPRDTTVEVCTGWVNGNPIISSFTLPKDQIAYDAAKANEAKACKPEANDQFSVNRQKPVGKFVFGTNSVTVKPIGDSGQIAYQAAALRNRTDKIVLSGHVKGVFAQLYTLTPGSHVTYYVEDARGKIVEVREYIVRESRGIEAHSDAYLHPEKVQGDLLGFTCFDPVQLPDGSWFTQTTWMVAADLLSVKPV